MDLIGVFGSEVKGRRVRIQFVWDSVTVTFEPACLGIVIFDIENSGLWRCDTVSQGEGFPTVQMSVMPSS